MVKRIAHIDMDAFFVAIELRENPELIGKPVVVGGSGGRGVVTSASYEARRYGIHSGMPSARARQLCPETIFLKSSGEKYSEASKQVRAIINNYSPDVEFTSVDEGYFDLTGTSRLLGRPLDIIQRVRKEVLKVTGCSASLGVSGTRLCSKVASKFSKPGGTIEIAPGREETFLSRLPLQLLPGAGGKIGERLAGFGVTRIGQLVTVGEQFLRRCFGAAGTGLYLNALGGKMAPYKSYRDLPRKSVSHERTFEDTTDFSFLQRILFRLCERCCRTLRDERLVCRTVTLKIRLADFRTYTRSRTLLSSSDSDMELFQETRKLMHEFDLPRVSIRLIGISLSKLSEECQWGLFSNSAKFWRLYCGIDTIRDKYGFDSIVSGLVLNDESTARYQGKLLNPFLAPKYIR